MITMEEKVESRRTVTGENASTELVFIVRGTADDISTKEYVLAHTQTKYPDAGIGPLWRQSVDVEPVWVDTAPIGGMPADKGLWTAIVRYGLKEPKDPDETVAWTFDTSGGTQHITQCLSNVGRYAPAGQVAPNFQGAIGVTRDAVEGVDLTVPAFRFSVTRYLTPEQVTPEYIGHLFLLTGSVNAGVFTVWGLGNFQAGEGLFLGASGSRRDDGNWEINYNFAGSPNRENIVIGAITVPLKKGWDYLWVLYDDEIDQAANPKRFVKRPIAVYIEKVYRDGDFRYLTPGYVPEPPP